MKKLNPDWIAHRRKVANQCGYFRLNSMELKDISPGRVRVEIPLGPQHLQPFGVAHGGVYATIIDAACFWAVYAGVEEGVFLTSADLKVNYLAPASEGKLVALGRAIRLGRTLSLSEARVEDQAGRLVAHGTSTLIALPNGPSLAQDGPPKFLK